MFDVTTSIDLEPDECRGVWFEADGVLMVMEETESDGILFRSIDTLVPQGDLYRRVYEDHRLVLHDPDDVLNLFKKSGCREVDQLEPVDPHKSELVASTGSSWPTFGGSSRTGRRPAMGRGRMVLARAARAGSDELLRICRLLGLQEPEPGDSDDDGDPEEEDPPPPE